MVLSLKVESSFGNIRLTQKCRSSWRSFWYIKYNRNNFESEIKFEMLKKCQIQKNESLVGAWKQHLLELSGSTVNLAVRPNFKISGYLKVAKNKYLQGRTRNSVRS